MKKRINVEMSSSTEKNAVSQKNGSGTFKCLINDNNAWADLILSKTALIFATVIILIAVYSLAGSSSDLVKKDELEVITTELASNIDAVGSVRLSAENTVLTYDFDMYSKQLIDFKDLNVSVSGEYVSCVFMDNGHDIFSARPLSYSTLPFNQSQLRTLLLTEFGADGNPNHSVHSAFPYTDLTDFLAIKAAEELYLNTSKDVLMEKTSVFVTDGTGVNELEYVLVYQ